MSNPIDEYLEEREKVALKSLWGGPGKGGLGSVFSKPVIGTVVGTAALSAALDIPGQVARKAYYAVTKTRDFNKMMETDPTLKQFQREDSKRFNSHYNSLRSMNPQFASDPVIAGSYMRQMSQNPETAGKVIVESLGGLPRPEAPTLGPKDIAGMTEEGAKPMNPLQQAQLAGMPAASAREQEMHEARMLQMGDQASMAPLQQKKLRQETGMHSIEQDKRWGALTGKRQKKRNP